MKFIIEREHLLKPLQQVSGPLGKRPTLPILNNLLIQVINNTLLLTGTDLEIEIVAKIILSQPYEDGSIAIPARKFLDICRNLPIKAKISVYLKGNRILINSGVSRFSLSTLPATDFPNLDCWQSTIEFVLPQKIMKHLIESTQFSMAHQDVRYYLNGMLFETGNKYFRVVATDGHRLATYTTSTDIVLPNYSVIVPRKGIVELLRILESNDTLLHIQIGSNNIRICIDNFIFNSKLIDGCFPDYHLAFPKKTNKYLELNCNVLRQAFSRAAILSNEVFRKVHLYIYKNTLRITSSNQEQEEFEEILDDVIYHGEKIEISFNVSYILDVLNVLKCENVRILLTDSMSSIQIENTTSKNATYIVMPIRL